MVLVISTSLNPHSKSFRLAQAAVDRLQKTSNTELVDLRNFPLPICNANDCYADPNVTTLTEKIGSAGAVIVASPVYNFDLNSAAKNLVELTGQSAWKNKIVGLMLSAGGGGSYMSAMPFANSLMLDFRCLIVPRFVYATEDAFDSPDEIHRTIAERVDELCAEILRISDALKTK